MTRSAYRSGGFVSPPLRDLRLRPKGKRDERIAKKEVYENAIARWPEEDRPREKLLKYGAHILSNSVLDVVDMDEGDVAKTHPSIRKIMLRAAQAYAAGVITVHNHPSGDLTPSEQDKLLTRDLVVTGRTMEIRVFDHMIIGDGQYFSFADEGVIEEYEMQAIP